MIPSYSTSMPTPFESAVLNLELFKLRREPVLREAREWFVRDFNPASFEELVTIAGGGAERVVPDGAGGKDIADC